MLEVGSISVKNTKKILVRLEDGPVSSTRAPYLTLCCCVLSQPQIKKVFDASIGAICWWLLGWSFAFGGSAQGFIGRNVRSNHFGCSVQVDRPD